MFIRLLLPNDRKELLVNVNHISLIEVLYTSPPDAKGVHWRTSLEQW